MTTFAISSNPSPEEIAASINYVLANIQTTNTSNPSTGQITNPTGSVVGYLYQYIFVKYADSFDGTVNFSNSPTGRSYYGLRNSNSNVESTNPADYIWTQVVGGFGSTRFLYYLVTGGRQAQFQVSTTTPNPGWAVDPGTAIDLDVITSALSGPANFIVNRITGATTAPTDAECISAIGRTPTVGDLCTVVYSSGLGSILYKYQTGGWAVWQPYISTDLILSNTIVANNIAANTITGNKIAAATITADNMVANTITAASGIIADAAITTAKIGDLQITTGKIQDNAITASASQASSTTFTFTAPAGAVVTILIQVLSSGGSVVTSGLGLIIANAPLYKNGSLVKRFYMPITQYYVTASNLLYGLADATVSYMDIGDGFSNTYSISIPSGASTCNWTALIAKK